MDVLPANTIAIYSFSKYFGATGWRLGVVALYRDSVLDRAIAALPPDDLAVLDCRYESISTATRDIRSSTGWSPTAVRSRSTTPRVSRSRSRCR